MKWMVAFLMMTMALGGCISGEQADDAQPASGAPSAAPANPPQNEEVNAPVGSGAFVDDSHVNGGPRGFLPDEVTGMQFLGNANPNGTRGIWINDDTAYLSGNAGLRIVDVTNPAKPVLLAEAVEGTTGGGSRDVDFILHPDGRSFAVMSRGGVVLVDVTDPTDPFVVSEVILPEGSHNMAVVPGTTIVYNSRSVSTEGADTTDDGASAGRADIIDFSNPEKPINRTWEFPATYTDPNGATRKVSSGACHDVTFDIDRNRAFCAAVSETHVWDVSDPWNPYIVQVIDWPGVQIHHAAWSTSDGNILILGDEFAGAIAGACASPENPYATLWFFDITDLTAPLPLGYFNANYSSAEEENTALCTTHFGTLVEDKPLFVIGWYTAGVILVDFSDPSNPVQVDSFRPDGDMSVWEARYYKGHVFTGDSFRGMDVLKIV